MEKINKAFKNGTALERLVSSENRCDCIHCRKYRKLLSKFNEKNKLYLPLTLTNKILEFAYDLSDEKKKLFLEILKEVYSKGIKTYSALIHL